MTHPDDDTPLTDRTLLDEARLGLGPSHADQARLRRAVLAATALGAVAASAAGAHAAGAGVAALAEGAAPAAAGLGSATGLTAGGSIATGIAAGLAGKLALGAALALAVGVGVWGSGALDDDTGDTTAAAAHERVEASGSAERPGARPSTARTVGATLDAIADDEPAAATPVTADDEPTTAASLAPLAAPRGLAPGGPARREEPAEAPDPVAEEARLIARAHAALDRHDGTAALRLLDEHQARFPDGVLAEERAATRVLALAETAEPARACRAAAAFLSTYPASIHAPRVRASCPDPGAAE